MGKRELDDLLCLSSWCLVIVVWLFLAAQRVCLQFVIVVFPDRTHLLFLVSYMLFGPQLSVGHHVDVMHSLWITVLNLTSY